jgi:hypothetical protein
MTRALGIPPESEKSFMAAVIQLAELNGFLVYHTHDSRRSQAGFPDLLLVKPPRALAFELKSMTGKVSPAQKLWLDALSKCGIRCFVFRPNAKQDIARLLAEDACCDRTDKHFHSLKESVA